MIDFALRVPAEVATYFTWGWVSVSVPNLIVIVTMIALFVLALLLPFPRDRHDSRNDS